MKLAQFPTALSKNRSKDHQPAAFGKNLPGPRITLKQDPLRKPFKGKNPQPGKTANFTGGKKAALQFEGGLARGEKQQLAALGIRQHFADFLKATVRLSRTGRTEEKLDAHANNLRSLARFEKKFE
jgi:hypothetical protein